MPSPHPQLHRHRPFPAARPSAQAREADAFYTRHGGAGPRTLLWCVTLIGGIFRLWPKRQSRSKKALPGRRGRPAILTAFRIR